MKMTTGLAVGIGIGPFGNKAPTADSGDIIDQLFTTSNGAAWVVAERDGSDNLTDIVGGGRTLSLPGGSANPVLLAHTGADYFWFPGTTGNNLSIAGLSNSTTYDYTVTYLDTTTATGSETTDGSGNLVFGNTQTNFSVKKVTKIEVEPSGGGASVADVRATSADPDATTFSELISTLTVTINRSASGYVLEVVDQPVYTFATDDYMRDANSTFWNIAADESMTWVVVGRTTSGNFQLATRSGGDDGFQFTGDNAAILDTGTQYNTANGGAFVDHLTHSAAGVVNRSDDTIRIYLDASEAAASGSIVGAGAPSPSVGLVLMARPALSTTAQNYIDGTIIGAAFIKEALTAQQISDVADALIVRNGGTP